MPLDVYLLPAGTSAEELTGRTVVVIDILRATTTITQALVAGAREVIPCLEIDEARKIAAGLPDAAVLGGERSGRRIEGFHLGNSPAEYTAEAVRDKTVIFTTTNGTRAMQLCRGARRVLLGAFNNLSAVVAELRGEDDFVLLCAGTDGHVTREDVLFAGAVIGTLIEYCPVPQPWNDEAFLASCAWGAIAGHEDKFLLSCLVESRGGRNLVSIGMAEDVAFAAKIDTTHVVAELQVNAWRIRPVRSD